MSLRRPRVGVDLEDNQEKLSERTGPTDKNAWIKFFKGPDQPKTKGARMDQISRSIDPRQLHVNNGGSN